jgi:hypothetical protein
LKLAFAKQTICAGSAENIRPNESAWYAICATTSANNILKAIA